ncbi:MAG: thioesterase family protein [Proteobacteria bacterium]|nr:thioesterase family protein [Pseudomonadota bacterium]
MGDFEHDTAVQKIEEGHYQTELNSDWKLWGPSGGYISAVALRAAGDASRFDQPASIVYQCLSIARFETVDIHVVPLRIGKGTESLRVDISQEDNPVLSAQVWTVGPGDGLSHDPTRAPDVPDPEELQNMSELTDGENGDLGFFANMEQRPVDSIPFDERESGESVVRNWFRFRPNPHSDDLFADATRALVLIDTFSWLTNYSDHPIDGPAPWIAPNLDLHVRFHAKATSDDWLFSEMRADIVKDGRIRAKGTVWTRDRKLVASGLTQLFYRPRPKQFR